MTVPDREPPISALLSDFSQPPVNVRSTKAPTVQHHGLKNEENDVYIPMETLVSLSRAFLVTPLLEMPQSVGHGNQLDEEHSLAYKTSKVITHARKRQALDVLRQNWQYATNKTRTIIRQPQRLRSQPITSDSPSVAFTGNAGSGAQSNDAERIEQHIQLSRVDDMKNRKVVARLQITQVLSKRGPKQQAKAARKTAILSNAHSSAQKA